MTLSPSRFVEARLLILVQAWRESSPGFFRLPINVLQLHTKTD